MKKMLPVLALLLVALSAASAYADFTRAEGFVVRGELAMPAVGYEVNVGFYGLHHGFPMTVVTTVTNEDGMYNARATVPYCPSYAQLVTQDEYGRWIPVARMDRKISCSLFLIERHHIGKDYGLTPNNPTGDKAGAADESSSFSTLKSQYR